MIFRFVKKNNFVTRFSIEGDYVRVKLKPIHHNREIDIENLIAKVKERVGNPRRVVYGVLADDLLTASTRLQGRTDKLSIQL